MGVFTRLERADAEAIATAYGLGEVRGVRGIAAGSVNSNYALECTAGLFFLRIYEEQDAAGGAAERRMLAALEGRGVKTPAPLGAAREVSVAGKPVAVFPWRAGGMRCQASVTVEDARRVGAELARVHVAGEGVEVGEGRFRVEDLWGRIEVIRGASGGNAGLAGEAGWLGEKLGEWTGKRAPAGAVPEGLIHGDLFRDNVLWEREERGEIAALLDFESASRGRFVFDLMVTVLAWGFGEGLRREIARGICDGYRGVRELGEEERGALLAEGCVAALRFTITRVTDYAMRGAGIGERVMKDWRRFAMRLRTLEELGEGGVRATLGVP
ncbi:MAG: homoserine kinase [Polyangiaceae bacterium]